MMSVAPELSIRISTAQIQHDPRQGSTLILLHAAHARAIRPLALCPAARFVPPPAAPAMGDSV